MEDFRRSLKGLSELLKEFAETVRTIGEVGIVLVVTYYGVHHAYEAFSQYADRKSAMTRIEQWASAPTTKAQEATKWTIMGDG